MRKKPLPLSTCLAAVLSVWRKVRQRRERSDRAPRSAITFLQINFLQASGTPENLSKKKKKIRKNKTLRLPPENTQRREKSSKSTKVKEHLEPGTFKTGRVEHEAEKSRRLETVFSTWSRQKSERKKKKSP